MDAWYTAMHNVKTLHKAARSMAISNVLIAQTSLRANLIIMKERTETKPAKCVAHF
jgi:hypothetical protein